MKKNIKNKDDRKDIILLAITLFIALIFVVSLWLTNLWIVGDSPNPGIFGDMFGAVNSLFSGLAFAGIIITILLQRNELKLQRQELIDTREVLAEQRDEFAIQNTTLRMQSFENTFFQMLNRQSQILDAIDIQGKTTRTGHDCFRIFYSTRFKNIYTAAKKKDPSKDEKTLINEAYEKFYERSQADVGHYFRNLYQIIKFIRNADVVKTADKKIYTNIVRAQLSSNELALLFYNCLSDYGRGKFKPLLEEFAFLDNMNPTLIISELHFDFYDKSAFPELGKAKN